MTKFKNFTVAAFAAATVLLGSLAAPPTASAAMSCSTAMSLAGAYIALANVLLATGNPTASAYWSGKAQGLMAAAC